MYRRLCSAFCTIAAALECTYSRRGLAAFIVQLGELERTLGTDPALRRVNQAGHQRHSHDLIALSDHELSLWELLVSSMDGDLGSPPSGVGL
jgi:hypothetical protein